jgi:hypothetical protein
MLAGSVKIEGKTGGVFGARECCSKENEGR